jgi:Arc/MetJ-type ribon-helix-helix transcriptional regulator
VARVPTERVTVRLNKLQLTFIDNLVATGEIRNRTHAIAEAVKDYVTKKSGDVLKIKESAKQQMELSTLVATLQSLEARVNKLQKK